jgi:hypothetical protein
MAARGNMAVADLDVPALQRALVSAGAWLGDRFAADTQVS